MDEQSNRDIRSIVSEGNRHGYDSQLMSLIIIVMVSAFGKVWFVLLAIGAISAFWGIAVLATGLFVRRMTTKMAKIATPTPTEHASLQSASASAKADSAISGIRQEIL